MFSEKKTYDLLLMFRVGNPDYDGKHIKTRYTYMRPIYHISSTGESKGRVIYSDHMFLYSKYT